MRRLRYNDTLRQMIQVHRVDVGDLVMPVFIKAGIDQPLPIASMPDICQWPLAEVVAHCQSLVALGIKSVLLFGIPVDKDDCGSESWDDRGIVQQALRAIKAALPDLLLIADVCFCEYTDHGHCGVWDETHHTVSNAETLPLLARQAVSFAQAGADVLAPSGMIDGMVAAIRQGLDQADFAHLPILSYAIKYASCLYGPFRDAAEGAPKYGDRCSYQADPTGNDALREAAQDMAEGADMLMVKPAHTYLDVVHQVKQAHPGVPLAVYHVSGEYAMLKAVAEKGWLDEKRAVMEVMTAFKRAGADIIISYYAAQIATWLATDGNSAILGEFNKHFFA